jgi:hypothetical protein
VAKSGIASHPHKFLARITLGGCDTSVCPCVCLHSTGVLLPLPAWYCLEVRSRARFYTAWQQQQQQQEQQQRYGGRREGAEEAALEYQHQQQRQQRVLAAAAAAAAPVGEFADVSLADASVDVGSSDGVWTQGQQQQQQRQRQQHRDCRCSGCEAGDSGGGECDVCDQPGAGCQGGCCFQLPIVSLAMALAAVAASSSLVLLSYGPQLLALQNQVVAW